jgi:hypothetical protein
MEQLENEAIFKFIRLVLGLVLVKAISQKVYEKVLEFWHTSSPCEWMIVLRGGE